jgi:hypothetical protein
MPSTKYKHHDIVVAWLEGKTIQIQGWSGNPLKWIDMEKVENSTCLPVFNINTNYRIKPEPVVVRYRRVLWKGFDNMLRVEAMRPTDTLPAYEKSACFVKWIDTEWQEYVVEDSDSR